MYFTLLVIQHCQTIDSNQHHAVIHIRIFCFIYLLLFFYYHVYGEIKLCIACRKKITTILA